MSIEDVQAAASAAAPVELPPEYLDGIEPPAEDADLVPPEAHAATFEANDFGNGQRLAHYFGENLIHVPRLGWFRWDGQRWAADEDGTSVRRDAQRIGPRIKAEIPHLALDEWQMENLEAWRLVRREWRDLEKIPAADLTDEQKARMEALEVVKDLGTAAETAMGQKRKSHISHAKASGNSGKITNMMLEAAVQEGIETAVIDLDIEPDKVNTRTGVLRFTQRMEDAADISSHREPRLAWHVDLEPHDRGQMITKVMNADYDPDAEAPTFMAFLRQVQPDPEIRDFLQRWAGYSLLGRTTEHKLVFNYGIGRNGKSTLVDTLAWIFNDYGTTLPIESLTGSEQRKGSDATPDLMRLPGARFVRASEPEQGTKMKEALIKALTGGEAILVRRMHAEFVEIVPEFKLWISGNHKPEIRGQDDGIWKRVVLVPWAVQIPDDQIDMALPAKLKAERNGILNWMVEGALRYLNEGLPIPEPIREATADYRKTSDPTRDFLMSECTITGEMDGDRITATRIRDAFNAWMMDAGENTWTTGMISRRIGERVGVVKGPTGMDYAKLRSNGVTGWKGIKLNATAVDRLEEYQLQIDDLNRRQK